MCRHTVMGRWIVEESKNRKKNTNKWWGREAKIMCSRSNNHTARSGGEPNNTEAGELRTGGIARKNGEEMKRS